MSNLKLWTKIKKLKVVSPRKHQLKPLSKKKMNLKVQLPQKMSLNQWKNLRTRTKTTKYHNQRTNYKGIVFDSKKEANRAFELDLLVRAGQVKKWSAQPEFKIELNGVKICKYLADFKVEYPDGHTEYEDVKGFRTAIYKLKKKLVKAFYGIEIIEL